VEMQVPFFKGFDSIPIFPAKRSRAPGNSLI
jgi:hypothetical protein